ncbi:MAG: hypothetical protein WBB28_12255 [Crinalium sp.]
MPLFVPSYIEPLLIRLILFRGRKQILDYVAQVEKYRAKANLIQDPVLREKIANAKVIVYTDLNPPVRGQYFKLIEEGKLEIRPMSKN